MIYFVRRGELRGGREKRRSDSKVLDKVGGTLERGKGFPLKSLQGIFGKGKDQKCVKLKKQKEKVYSGKRFIDGIMIERKQTGKEELY